jgi:NTP pyrophosphatase (non-canonical NTP hydrolase)
MLRGLIEIYKIMSWHKKTFPEFTAINQKKKVRDEAHELVEAFRNFIQNGNCSRQRHVEEELSDVIIASVNAMRYPEIRKEVLKKMKENHKRSWKNGQHKR